MYSFLYPPSYLIVRPPLHDFDISANTPSPACCPRSGPAGKNCPGPGLFLPVPLLQHNAGCSTGWCLLVCLNCRNQAGRNNKFPCLLSAENLQNIQNNRARSRGHRAAVIPLFCHRLSSWSTHCIYRRPLSFSSRRFLLHSRYLLRQRLCCFRCFLLSFYRKLKLLPVK